MGYYLINKQGRDFSFNSSTWLKILDIAMEHGWKPEGHGERGITDHDALHLADALERALPDFPEEDIEKTLEEDPGHTQLIKRMHANFLEKGVTNGDPTAMSFAKQAQSRTIKGGLTNFISFCREGGFTIS